MYRSSVSHHNQEGNSSTLKNCEGNNPLGNECIELGYLKSLQNLRDLLLKKDIDKRFLLIMKIFYL